MAVRHGSPELPPTAERVIVGDLGSDQDWRAALSKVDVVVHLAARVHVMRDNVEDPMGEFRRANVTGTEILARQAAAAGVRRFVFLSSIKVNGEGGTFSEANTPAPKDAYGISKHEAELCLARIARGTPMTFTVIRPPLVYGPGVKANFRALIRVVDRGLPLPFGAVSNRRSFVGLDNLVDFIVTCMDHPAAANETFLVSDGEDISTADLVRKLARVMGRPARLIPVPASTMTLLARVVNRREIAQRLIGSLQVDISKARTKLGWAPPISMDEELRRTASTFV